MANLVLKRGELYPPGTKVKVFTLAQPFIAELDSQVGSPAAWHPPQAELEEVTTDSEGKTTITTAVSGVPYVCWAQVAGVDVYLKVVGT